MALQLCQLNRSTVDISFTLDWQYQFICHAWQVVFILYLCQEKKMQKLSPLNVNIPWDQKQSWGENNIPLFLYDCRRNSCSRSLAWVNMTTTAIATSSTIRPKMRKTCCRTRRWASWRLKRRNSCWLWSEEMWPRLEGKSSERNGHA